MSENSTKPDSMRSEYDFSNGVRGKHYLQLREGYTVTVHNEDGTTTTEKYEPTEGVIILDPDVRQFFPDSETVNRTLRSLIELIPQKS
ncbi:MAG: ABC transporter ATP-binding protein [Ardenticatenaceae bacterium]|nr:ABC transporter ATP-binding protein [Ardenticatenaceae bacterium]MCB8988300.1 ABC transporter ATP-binding protein [Ardenticatenaceae bacterium]